MVRLLFFFMLISYPSLAEDVVATTTTEQPENMEIIKEIKDLPSASMQKTSPKPEETILYTVEKKIIPMPECNSAKLIADAKEHISSFLQQTAISSTLFRRRRHFILKSLKAFTTENISDYKTSAQSPVSDIIADLKMNRGILEENMRLCKNENVNSKERSIFLLIWPEGEKYQVQVINLSDKKRIDMKTSFVYEK